MCVYKVAKVVERSRFLCGTGEVANGDRDLAFVECDMRCARSCDLRRVNTAMQAFLDSTMDLASRVVDCRLHRLVPTIAGIS
jgi:hypothetical protein